MSLLRSGASKKYSENWADAFGSSRASSKSGSSAKGGGKKKKPSAAKKSKAKTRTKAGKK